MWTMIKLTNKNFCCMSLIAQIAANLHDGKLKYHKLHKPVEGKFDWIRTNDREGVISTSYYNLNCMKDIIMIIGISVTLILH